MAYDGAMLLASMVLLIPILAIAALLHLVLRKLRLVPAGRLGLAGYALVVVGGYSLLLIFSAVQMLVFEPAHLQKKYLGRVYAGPLALRSYAHSGFQDPADEWKFRLDEAALSELKRRCVPEPSMRGAPGRCALYSGQDARWFAGVWIEGKDLRMIDGLH